MAKAAVVEKRLMGEVQVNKEVLSYLRGTEYSQETYLFGIDSATGLIWSFTPDHIYLCTIDGDHHRRQLIDYKQLSRNSQISRTRPVVACHGGSYFPILSTGRELVTFQCFEDGIQPFKRGLENLKADEYVLQMSNIISFNHDEPSWIFASITNLGSVFTHELRLGGHNGLIPELISWKSVSSQPSQGILSTAAQVMSSFLFSNSDTN